MPLARKLKRELEWEGVCYRLSNHVRSLSLLQAAGHCGIAPQQIAVAHLLQVQDEFILAIHRLDRELDLAAVEALLKMPALTVKAPPAGLFPDCEPGMIPPVPGAYGLKAIWDEALLSLREVSFSSGSQTALVTVTGAAFRTLLERFPCAKLSHPLSDLSRLPFPEVRQPESVPPALREVIARFLKYRPELLSEDEAVLNLLQKTHCPQPARSGFEAVTHVALGMHAGREFKLTEVGPLGQQAFWEHAFSCAFLCKFLGERVGLPADLAYLAGFLHNFGLLLLSFAFRSEYTLLNKFCMLEPKTPLPVLEKKLLCPGSISEIVGRGHAKMGGWLTKAWHLPEMISTVCEFHHAATPPPEHAPYVALVAISNALLKTEGIGDADVLPPPYARPLLGLKETDLVSARAAFLQKQHEIQSFLKIFLSQKETPESLHQVIGFLA